MKKSRFKTVTWVIVIALIAVAGLQVFSLSRMYSDMNRRFAQTVSSAMERSAYEELVMRPHGAAGRPPNLDNLIGSVRTQPIQGDIIRVDEVESIKIQKNDGGKFEIKEKQDSDNTGHGLHEEGLEDEAIKLSMEFILSTEGLDIDSAIYDSLSTPPQVAVSPTVSGNVTIYVLGDSERGVQTYSFTSSFYSDETLNSEQFHRYDSLLTQNLMRAGIYSPHKASVLVKESDDILYTEGEDIINPIRFETPLGIDGETVCRVEIPNPNRGFLKEMGWIIASSTIILILLCFAFIYLLRTMFRQRSVEEMRIDFTHNITHELKTPIAVAYAANDAMLNFSADSDPARREEYLKIVQTQLGNLSEMVEKILSMSVGEESNLKLRLSEVSLRPLMERILADYEIKNDKPIRAELNVDPAGLTVIADKFHLANILGNLVDNAVKYSGESVEISIGAMRKEGFTEITISDDGIGIPASSLGLIFDKFYRVPTGNMHNIKGFGLGLYYARMVVEGHGGTISVKSREGRGTTFVIKLPEYG